MVIKYMFILRLKLKQLMINRGQNMAVILRPKIDFFLGFYMPIIAYYQFKLLMFLLS